MKTLEEIQAAKKELDREEELLKLHKLEAFQEVSKDWRAKYNWSVRDPVARHLEAKGDTVCFMAELSQESKDDLEGFRSDYGRTPMGRHQDGGFSSVMYGWTPVPHTAKGPLQMGVVWHDGGGTLVLGPPDKPLGGNCDRTIFCTKALWTAVKNLYITPDEFKDTIRDNKHLNPPQERGVLADFATQ